MNPRFDLILYIGVMLTLGYLIYRYARYNKWESTDAGRAFMGMKLCLLALVTYALIARAFPEHEWRDEVRFLVVGGIWAALTYQVQVLVRYQGGWRRKRAVQRWVPYKSDQPRDSQLRR